MKTWKNNNMNNRVGLIYIKNYIELLRPIGPVQSMMKPDKIMMLSIFHMRFMTKTKLSYYDQSDRVQYIMKTKQNNDITDRTGTIYAKNDTELSWLIEPGVVYDENQIGQQHDWLNRYGLR